MKTIEAIWKEGFLNENRLIAPKINDLYNRKSQHLVDRMQRMFRINLIAIVIMAIIFPVIYYAVDATREGIAASILLLLTAWYNKRQMRGLKRLDQGTTSLDYLKSLDQWLEDVFVKSERIAGFSYPLYLMIGLITIWSAWNKQGLALKIYQKFPDLIFIGDIPLFALIILAAAILLMFSFSVRIYKWEVRLMYGRVIDKLKETIAEMEKLKQKD